MSEIGNYVIPLMAFFLVSALLVTMPSTLMTSGTYYTDLSLPEYFQGENLRAYTHLENITLNINAFESFGVGLYRYQFTLGDYDFFLILTSSYSYIQLGRVAYITLFGIPILPAGIDLMEWRNVRGTNRGTSLNTTELDGDQEFSTNAEVVRYYTRCQDDRQIGVNVFLGWNSSFYDAPSEALSNGTMVMVCGSGLNETISGVNGIALILSLLTFQPPNVPYPFNYLLSGFFIIPIMVLSVFVIIKLIHG